MDWEDPFTTGVLFVAFVWTTCRVNAEYALSCPLFVVLALVTKALLDRRSGAFKEYWVNQGGGLVVEEEDLYQPVLSLRIAIVGFRNLPDVHTTTTSTATTTTSATVATYKQSIAPSSKSGREGDGKSTSTEAHTSDPTESGAGTGTRANDVGGGGRSGSDSSSESLQTEDKDSGTGGGGSGGNANGGRKKTTTHPPFVRVVYLPMADDELKLSLSDDDDDQAEVQGLANGDQRPGLGSSSGTRGEVDDLYDNSSSGDDESEGEEEGDESGRIRAVSSSSGTTGSGTSSAVSSGVGILLRSQQTQAQRRRPRSS